VIAFTGTRDLRGGEEAVIVKVLGALPPASWLVVGGAEGVDTAVARIGKALGHHIHLVIPAAYWCLESADYAETTEYARRGSSAAHSYKLRDERMVELGDSLIAFPPTAVEEVRSGTWMTIRIARRLGKPYQIYPLRGTER